MKEGRRIRLERIYFGGMYFDEALSKVIEAYGPVWKVVNCFDEDTLRSLLLRQQPHLPSFERQSTAYSTSCGLKN